MRAFLPLSVTLCLLGCARGPDLPEARAVQPRFSLQRADVEAIHTDGMDTTFRFAVHNPYHGVTGMEEVRWALTLPGGHVREGVTEGLDFDGARAGVLDVPITIAWSELGGQLDRAREEGGIPWQMHATAVFDLPREDVSVPTSGEGVLPYAPPPEASLVGVVPLSLGEEPAVELHLDVSGMPRAARLSYRLDVGYLHAARGVANTTWEGDRVSIAVPIEARTFEALREGTHVRLRATADVRTPYGVAPLALDVEDTVALGGVPRI